MASFWDMHNKLSGRRKPADRPDLPAPPKQEGRGEPLTVSQLTARIRGALQSGLPGQIIVRGEVSEWNHAPSGHRYFCLKDQRTSLTCIMWQSDAAGLRFEPQVGQELIAFGSIDVYAARGEYQLRCHRLEPFGQGAQELAYRQLVEKLQREGLFERSRKKALPPYPERICIVTSPRAAGYQDVLKVLRACRHLRLFLYAVPVQGVGAAARIAEALVHLSRRHGDIGGIDVVMLIRGGGSAEDLWVFNEEPVARALAEMSLPVITGIGHETDRTIADLVADVEAHTPTEAAQVLVRQWKNAPDRVEQLGIVLRRNWRQLQRDRRDELAGVMRQEVFQRPFEAVNRRRRRLDEKSFALARAFRGFARRTSQRLHDLGVLLEARHPRQKLEADRRRALELASRLGNAWSDVHDEQMGRVVEAQRRLEWAVQGRIKELGGRVFALEMRLQRQSPEARARLVGQRVQGLAQRLQRAQERVASVNRSRIQSAARQLAALDPTAVLRRGYSLTILRRTGALLRSPADARPGDVLITRTAEGELTSTVGEARQGKLFE